MAGPTGAALAWRRIDGVSAVVLAATFAAVAVLQLPLLDVMAALVPLSIGIAWLRVRRAS